MITESFEITDGDMSEGKKAFAGLVDEFIHELGAQGRA